MIPERNTLQPDSIVTNQPVSQYDEYTPTSALEHENHQPYRSPESTGESTFSHAAGQSQRLASETHPGSIELPINTSPSTFPIASPWVETTHENVEHSRTANEHREKTAEPEMWTSDGPLQFGMPAYDPWEKCKNVLERHDHAMCKGWTDDVDTMLVFAGLFSAVATSFCVEAYQLLSEQPTVATNALLLIIAQQATGNSVSMPGVTDSVTDFVARPLDIAINALYFVSLALALIVASICILCKQWLREYQRDLSLSHVDAVRLRQLRYLGLVTWKVPQILSSLPIILQLALLMFSCGVFLQLLETHLAILIPVAVVGFAAMAFIVVTSAAPGHQILRLYPGASSIHSRSMFVPYCPYRSPQAWVYYRALFWLKKWVSTPHHPRNDGFPDPSPTTSSQVTISTNSTTTPDAPSVKFKEWSDVDKADIHSRKGENMAKESAPEYLQEIRSALKWVSEHLGNSSEMHRCLLWCAERYVSPLRAAYGDKQLGGKIQSLHQALLVEIRDNPTFDALGDESWQLGVELQVKDVKSKLDDLTSRRSKPSIFGIYQTLSWDYHLLTIRSHRVPTKLKTGYLEALDQVALSLRYMFKMLLDHSDSSEPNLNTIPEDFLDWRFSETITRLMASLSDSDSSLAQKITREDIPELLSQILEKQTGNNVDFALALGSCVGRSLNRPEHLRTSPIRFPLFEVLVTFLVKEFASSDDVVDSVTRDRWRKWGRQVAEAAGKPPTYFEVCSPAFFASEGDAPGILSNSNPENQRGPIEEYGVQETRQATRRFSWLNPIVQETAGTLMRGMWLRGASTSTAEPGRYAETPAV